MAKHVLYRWIALGALGLLAVLASATARAQVDGEAAATALLRNLPILAETTDMAPSPDGRYALHVVGNPGAHRLSVETVKDHKGVDLLPVHGKVSIGWRPDSKLVFVNATRGENQANCEIFDPSAKPPLQLSLGNEAARKLGLFSPDDEDDISRFRLACVGWNTPNQLDVIIWWRDEIARKRAEFDSRRLVYDLKSKTFARRP